MVSTYESLDLNLVTHNHRYDKGSFEHLFKVIQLYLINDIYENHEAIYSTLYNIINDIKLTINLKELNQTLQGYVSCLFHIDG